MRGMQEAEVTDKGPATWGGSLCFVGTGVLKGQLSSSWISYSINYFSCGPDQIATRRHIKALVQLTA